MSDPILICLECADSIGLQIEWKLSQHGSAVNACQYCFNMRQLRIVAVPVKEETK